MKTLTKNRLTANRSLVHGYEQWQFIGLCPDDPDLRASRCVWGTSNSCIYGSIACYP